jgi:hypothetical protein
VFHSLFTCPALYHHPTDEDVMLSFFAITRLQRHYNDRQVTWPRSLVAGLDLDDTHRR